MKDKTQNDQRLHTVGAIGDLQARKTADAALNASETRYRRLFEAAHDGILILDPDTRKIIDANPFMTQLLGYSHEQLIGMELFEIGFLADAKASQEMFQTLKATRQVRYENLPLQARQGGLREVEVVANLYDEDGDIVVQCNVRDITERRVAEAALRESEILFRATFENAAVGIAHVGRDGAWLRVNQRLCQIIGYSADDLLAQTFQQITHPDDLDADVTNVQNMLAGVIDNYAMEKRYIHKDGGHIWVNLTVGCVRKIGGALDYFISAVEDISEKKRAETALHHGLQSIALAAEATGIGFWEWNVHTNVIRWDAQMFELYGVLPTDDGCITNETWRAAVLPEDFAENEAILNNTLQTNGQSTREFRIRRGDTGEWRTIQSVEAMRASHGIEAEWMVGTNVDITDRKRAEEHAQLLTAEVNHRAKNLLSVVQSIAQQTAKSGDPLTFAARLSDRIGGLAANQDLLVQNLWHGVGVCELVTSQLAHFRDLIGTRIYLHGPELTVTAAASQAIGMAVHELATNAAKYGALSNSNGQVHVDWQVTAGPDALFQMSWRESDGPQVKAPTHKGFGQTVIKRLVEASVDGNVKVDYAEDGFSWHLRTAAKDVLVMSGGGAE